MRTSVDRLVHESRGQNGNNLTFFKELNRNEGSVPG
jgi:hypothetical protein